MTARDAAALAASHGKLEAAKDALSAASLGGGLTPGERDVLSFALRLIGQVTTSTFDRVAAALGELERPAPATVPFAGHLVVEHDCFAMACHNIAADGLAGEAPGTMTEAYGS